MNVKTLFDESNTLMCLEISDLRGQQPEESRATYTSVCQADRPLIHQAAWTGCGRNWCNGIRISLVFVRDAFIEKNGTNPITTRTKFAFIFATRQHEMPRTKQLEARYYCSSNWRRMLER